MRIIRSFVLFSPAIIMAVGFFLWIFEISEWGTPIAILGLLFFIWPLVQNFISEVSGFVTAPKTVVRSIFLFVLLPITTYILGVTVFYLVGMGAFIDLAHLSELAELCGATIDLSCKALQLFTLDTLAKGFFFDVMEVFDLHVYRVQYPRDFNPFSASVLLVRFSPNVLFIGAITGFFVGLEKGKLRWRLYEKK